VNQIVVTGYNGFIGTNLVPELQKKYKVFGISNSFGKNIKIKRLKKDIKKIKITDIPKNTSHIIHLAAQTDVTFCEQNPQNCFEVNIGGTQNMLEIARKINIKFIFLSTSHVFGITKKLAIDENHLRTPTSIYSASKIAGEILCESYAKSYGMDISIIRLFSVYGPHSPPHLVSNKIINKIKSNKKIDLGNLFPKRDFIFVDDAIRAILLITKKTHGFETYNVGTGKATSISQLCSIIEKISHSKLKINVKKSLKRKNEIKKIVANTKKINRLGWTPQNSLNDGLKKTYDCNMP